MICLTRQNPQFSMRVLTAHDLDSYLSPSTLVSAIRDMFIEGAEVPLRHHHTIESNKSTGILLIMPAWTTTHSQSSYAGVKLVNVYPDNPSNNIPSIQGAYVLFDKSNGTPLAIMDGSALTLYRTAAASVLAATYLASKDSSTLLMVGTGRLAPFIVKAYTNVLSIKKVLIWGRTNSKASDLAVSLANSGIKSYPVDDLKKATEEAHIISCATMSHNPLIYGDWLKPGQHVDLIGSFTAEMRETNDEAILNSSVFVDTREGALTEAGDLIQVMRKGLFSPDDVKADLQELCKGVHPGRTHNGEITIFKSVGTSLEDLAAAKLAFERSGMDLSEKED